MKLKIKNKQIKTEKRRKKPTNKQPSLCKIPLVWPHVLDYQPTKTTIFFPRGKLPTKHK